MVAKVILIGGIRFPYNETVYATYTAGASYVITLLLLSLCVDHLTVSVVASSLESLISSHAVV